MASATRPRPVALVIWFLVLLFAQSAFLFRHVPPDFRPDLYVLFAVFLGVHFDSTVSLIVPFLLGLCHDALTVSPFGLSALVLLVAGYLPHTGRPDVYLEGTLTRGILVSVTTAAAIVIRLLVLLALGRDVASPWKSVLGQLAMHLVLFYPLFSLWSRHLVPGPEPAD